MSNFKTRLENRGYPARIVEKNLSEIKFSDRKMSLTQKNKAVHVRVCVYVCVYMRVYGCVWLCMAI